MRLKVQAAPTLYVRGDEPRSIPIPKMPRISSIVRAGVREASEIRICVAGHFAPDKTRSAFW